MCYGYCQHQDYFGDCTFRASFGGVYPCEDEYEKYEDLWDDEEDEEISSEFSINSIKE